MIFQAIEDLAAYAVRVGLLEKSDRVWAVNALLEQLGLSGWEEPAAPQERALEDILRDILDWAVENGRIQDGVTSRDLFDTALMGRLTPRPSQVIRTFWEKYAQSPQTATDWYYHFSQNTDYIRSYRVARDVKWVTPTPYGDLDITINLSKPEKDARAVSYTHLTLPTTSRV